MSNLIEEIKNLIKHNKLSEALLGLSKLISQSEYKHASILYKRELTELDKNFQLGLTSAAEASLLKTNISYKILELLDIFENLETSRQNHIHEDTAVKINDLIKEVNNFNSISQLVGDWISYRFNFKKNDKKEIELSSQEVVKTILNITEKGIVTCKWAEQTEFKGHLENKGDFFYIRLHETKNGQKQIFVFIDKKLMTHPVKAIVVTYLPYSDKNSKINNYSLLK